VYLQLHQPREALNVMDEGVALVGSDADMRFARALIRSAANDDAGALRDLQRIASAQRSEGMRSLLQSASVRASVAEATGAAADAQRLLTRAEHEAGDDAQLLWIVANAWFARAEPTHGVAVFDRLAARKGGQAQLPAQARLDHAALLSRARMDERLGQMLPVLQAASDWDAAQARRLAQLNAESLQRLIKARMAAGDRAEARELAQAPLWGTQHLAPGEADLARGRLRMAAEDWSGAEQALNTALVLQPDHSEVHLALATPCRAWAGATRPTHRRCGWAPMCQRANATTSLRSCDCCSASPRRRPRAP